MTLKKCIVLVASALLVVSQIRLLSLAQAAPAEDSIDDPTAGLMLAKLASSQAIVAGLVSKDFGQIERGARDMIRICDATGWEGQQDEVYGHHRQELRRQAFKLTQMAQDENLEGSAYVYMHTISTCINCHQHCRDVLRIAQRPETQGGVIPIPAALDIIDSNRTNVRR